MATDYDTPRTSEDDLREDSLEELKQRRDKGASVDGDETEEPTELPGADLSGEQLSVKSIPRQADEFTCSVCFLIHHRSQLAGEKKGQLVCKECAA